ncbi:MAG: hypothetical protein WAV46_01020 [Candidatus Moraniibacteriota bacterium]
MGKNIRQTTSAFSATVLLLALLVSGNISSRHILYDGVTVSVAHAEDDEDEYEGEDGKDDNDSSSASSSSTTKAKSTPTYKTVLVTKVIMTLDPIFTTDQDQDGIVDGLDPHPAVSEREYFTDDDNDGIANAFDAHQGEDDFTYYEQENDTNGNGILDSYESLGGS